MKMRRDEMSTKTFAVFVTTFVASLVISASAHAQRPDPPPADSPSIKLGEVLHTGPLDGEFMECRVANVGKDPLLVKPRIFDQVGTEVTSPGPGCEGLLAPGAACSTAAADENGFELRHAHCSIVVVGDKQNVRGLLWAATHAYVNFEGQFIQSTVSTSEAR